MIENMSGGWGIQVGNIEKPEVAIRTPRRNMNTSKKKNSVFCIYLFGRPPADDVRSDERITNRSIGYPFCYLNTDKTFLL
jgi:hypothetical protein